MNELCDKKIKPLVRVWYDGRGVGAYDVHDSAFGVVELRCTQPKGHKGSHEQKQVEVIAKLDFRWYD